MTKTSLIKPKAVQTGALLGALTLALTACQHTPTHTATPANLQGQWQIMTTTPATTLADNVLSFDKDGQGHFYAGCNHMNFRYQAGQTLDVKQMTSTRMACQNMTLEQFVGRHLPQMTQYTTKDGRLILSSDKATLTATPKP